MVRLFDQQCHLRCQNYTIIGGKVVNFLKQLSTHHWRFLLLNMDEYTKLYMVSFWTRGKIKLQLGTYWLAFTWILWLWFQFHWINKGSGYHETHVLCIAAYHVLLVVQQIYSFLNLELQWSSSLVGSFCNFYIGRGIIKNDIKTC